MTPKRRPNDSLLPQFPIYVPSKGRAQYMITSRLLSKMFVEHYLVVEPQEVELYEKAVREAKLRAIVLPLDLQYREQYEHCDTLGLTKSSGPGPARNFAWDHSMIHEGAAWHWVLDDNIRHFLRLRRNIKTRVVTASIFRAMEDFALRYTNVAMAGPTYDEFAKRKQKQPPFVMNTRIYSCNLIRNDVPFRWRGRYNEDTILALDMLKAGWCTVQFNAFLQDKAPTQALKGGCTTEFYHAEGVVIPGEPYAKDGTLAKSVMLAAVHPDVASVKFKFSRVHHHVDYSRFKELRLIRRPGLELPAEPNEYGMQLRPNEEYRGRKQPNGAGKHASR
jgi:TET-associated glycosyltransferase-like protein